MNYKYIKNNNSEIVITKDFIFKRFFKNCFDKNTINNFRLLDGLFNKRPIIVEVLDKENKTPGFGEMSSVGCSKTIKMKRLPEKSNLFYLLKKGKIINSNMSNIAKQLYEFHSKSGAFIKGKAILDTTEWHVDVFLERAKSDRKLFNIIKKNIKKTKDMFKKVKLEYKKIRIHGDFLINNIFLYDHKYFYVDFGHLDKHCQDFWARDVASFYVDLILHKKKKLAKYFLQEYTNLVKDKKNESLIALYCLDDLFFRYVINDGYYKNSDRNNVLLKTIQKNIIKILNEQKTQKN